MYVVKFIGQDGGADFRTFSDGPAAIRYFNKPDKGFFDGVTANLFDVPGVNQPEFAIALVEGGKAVCLKRMHYDVV